MEDLLGQALLDYHRGEYTEDPITETNMSEQEELSLPYLFRSYDKMPVIEKKALELARGTILDVGCGAGSHSLYLQHKGYDVTAIDSSEGAVQVARERGIKKVQHIGLLDLKPSSYDTILILMNGTGIFENTNSIMTYLAHLKSLLKKNGQILIDSSDIIYLYPEGDGGSSWVPEDRYYGELEFTLRYKDHRSEPFPWLYMDELRFQHYSEGAGFEFEVVQHGLHFDYLAKLSLPT